MNHLPPYDPVLEQLLSEGAYGGWFTNLFSLEGRAENAQNRADKARDKGKDKRADKLENKAASRKARAAKVETLKATFSNSPNLWVVGHPFSKREKSGGLGGSKTITKMAKGFRPTTGLYDLERRATIVGGLQILASAWDPQTNSMGYAPFNTLDVANLPVRTNIRKDDKALIKVVQQAAAAQGVPKSKRPKSLKAAAQYIREQAAERGLSSAAWSQRAVLMVLAGKAKSQTATTVAVGALATTGAIIGTILTAGAATPAAAAAIGGTVSGVTAIAVGGAKAVGNIKQTNLGGEWSRYELEVQNALKKREQRIQSEQLDRMTAVTEVIDEELAVATQERMKAIGQVVGTAFWVSAVILGVGVATRMRK